MNFHNVTDAMMKKGLEVNAGIQAKVWAGEMKRKRRNTKAKILLQKLYKKYPEFTESQIRDIARRHI